MKKRLALLAALVMAASTFTACGDSDSSSAAPATDNTSSVAETTTAPEESTPEETTAEETSSEADASSEDASSEGDSATDSEAGSDFEFNGTLETTGDYPGDWASAPFIIDNEGNTSGQFDYIYLEDFKDTGCTVTINYTIDKKIDMQNPDAGKTFYDFYSVAPCSAGATGWQKLYEKDQSFITGYENKKDVVIPDPNDDTKEIVKEDYDKEAYMQDDGFIVVCANDDGTWNEEGTLTFNLSPEAIQFVLADVATNDDGSQWGGIIFMVHGIIVKSVTVAAPEAAE